jgi:hypothetical protein
MDIVGLILEVAIEGGNKRENNGQGISSPSAEGLSILVIGKWITMLWERYWHVQNNRKGIKNVSCLQ